MKEKVYLVMCISDNLEEYENHDVNIYHHRICSTREKAEEYIKNWQPNVNEDETVTDDVNEINRLTDEDVEIDGKYLRHVLVGADKWYQNLYSFYITEEEVM